MTIPESPIRRSLSKRGLFVLLVIFASAFWVIRLIPWPQLAPGQKPLTDIHTIETLRTQFNRDAGNARLIILVSPT